MRDPEVLKISTKSFPCLPCLYLGTFETPLRYAPHPVTLRFNLEYIEPPAAKILFKPKLGDRQRTVLTSEDAILFECAQPGMIYQDTYYRFPPHIKRTHLLNLEHRFAI